MGLHVACKHTHTNTHTHTHTHTQISFTSLITEVNSNVAATAMLLPVVAQIAVALKVPFVY